MPVQFRDYYETLGVAKAATHDEIRKAFRKLARQHHPDVAKDKKNAEAKFKEINEAYEVLGDPEKRKKYDELGAGWENGGAPRGGGGGMRRGRSSAGGGPETEFEFAGTGFSDFFEAFFGSRGAGGAANASPFTAGTGGFGSRRGSDAEADISVSIEEVLNGSKRTISFQRNGKVETYSVSIPPGVRDGRRIRLAGRGGAGAGGGTAGDLYLNVRLAPDPDYEVDGDDLVREVPIQPWEAVLGGPVTFPTFDGEIRLKIPPGTESGQRFRIRGRGLPRNDGSRGDFYAVAEVQVPTKLTATQRALWEKLAALG